jgi:hypothetical protein
MQLIGNKGRRPRRVRMMPPNEVRHKERNEQDGSRRRTQGSAHMSMQSLKLNAEDRRVYETWLRKVILLWAFMVGTVVIVCTVLAWKQW